MLTVFERERQALPQREPRPFGSDQSRRRPVSELRHCHQALEAIRRLQVQTAELNRNDQNSGPRLGTD